MRAIREGTERSPGRRRALWGVSAAAVVVAGAAGLLGACGGGSHGGDYVAVGAAGEGSPGAGPTGGVRLVPLDGPTGVDSPGGGGTPAGRSENEEGAAASKPPADAPAGARPDAPGGSTPTPPRASGGSTPAPEPSASPPSPAPPSPAVLTAGEPVRVPTDRRWCEKVTLAFRNSGGAPVRSGTVTFGTHVIDTLGIDWATLESTEPLPAPIAPGVREEKTWTVCVDSWRVPLGMRVETRDVSVRWE
ncbi:hypothetical protein ACIBVL_13790 [Streptomyces sp. NPDC049687]|uniref:hypothetical protein n=1 Tax=Streptomyces sp. NPDC049687 TaxID=3365596 RepID=UPI0037993243